jgi:indole-3-glycerol phosphate synthase/phosphoribosylanthranilate isomerase
MQRDALEQTANQKNILAVICEQRRADIAKNGITFGCTIPETRTRPIVPFMTKPGTILEIKRASPSKGMIAFDLDAVKTARAYVKAGTEAISVLTEENYFHGLLNDLIAVANEVGTDAAVLRKDFLLSEEEITVSYKCGADAVLLIARMLPEDTLLAMAERAFSLGIATLLEIREAADCKKAYDVMRLAHQMKADAQLVLGINARNLATFHVDLLAPVKVRAMMEAYVASRAAESGEMLVLPPVVAESGIVSADDATFAGEMKFRGVLVGEAVARNPEHADVIVDAFLSAAEKECDSPSASFWKKIAVRSAHRPLVKICGITNEEDAANAAAAGADVLGFIFYGPSKRNVTAEKVRAIRSALEATYVKEQMPLLVGVVVSVDSLEGRAALSLVQEEVLDGIQFHSCAPVHGVPGYGAVRVQTEADVAHVAEQLSAGQHRVLLDAFVEDKIGGTGQRIDESLVKAASEQAPLWLAGGINRQNVQQVIESCHPELIDVSTGVENAPGKKDKMKLQQFFAALNEAREKEEDHAK